ncbi:MAG TPA: hypothetical protein VGM81_26610 [Burkholderiaceae bacterium]
MSKSGLPLIWALWRRHAHLRRRSERVASSLARIPGTVRAHWLAKASSEVPGWQPNPADWLLAAGALLQFFDCCRLRTTAQPCALPSRAADSVWHLWLAHEPESLAAFQRNEFGQAIPHVEAADLGADREAALAHSWALACRSEFLSATSRTVPLMFAADGLLGTPGGWAYNYGIFQNQVFHQDLDEQGRLTEGLHHHPGLTMVSLAALSLYGQQDSSYSVAK